MSHTFYPVMLTLELFVRNSLLLPSSSQQGQLQFRDQSQAAQSVNDLSYIMTENVELLISTDATDSKRWNNHLQSAFQDLNLLRTTKQRCCSRKDFSSTWRKWFLETCLQYRCQDWNVAHFQQELVQFIRKPSPEKYSNLTTTADVLETCKSISLQGTSK